MNYLDLGVPVMSVPLAARTMPWGESTRGTYTTTASKRRSLTGLGFIPITAGDPYPLSAGQVWLKTKKHGVRIQHSPYRVRVNEARPTWVPPANKRLYLNNGSPFPIYAVARDAPPRARPQWWPGMRAHDVGGHVRVIPQQWIGRAHLWPSKRYPVARNVQWAPRRAPVPVVLKYPNPAVESRGFAAP